MKQTTLVSTGFERHRKTTHRARFLVQMHQVVPWATLCALIEPHCREGLKSLPSAGIEKLLRVYFLQQWFNLRYRRQRSVVRLGGDERVRWD